MYNVFVKKVEFTQRDLEGMARDAALDTSRSPLQQHEEVCQRMCQRGITAIQIGFEKGKRSLLDLVKPDLVQVTIVGLENAEMGSCYLPHMQAADDLSDNLANEQALVAIEGLRAEKDALIAALQGIRDARIEVASVLMPKQ